MLAKQKHDVKADSRPHFIARLPIGTKVTMVSTGATMTATDDDPDFEFQTALAGRFDFEISPPAGAAFVIEVTAHGV